MSDDYQGLPKSDKWGCIVAALLSLPAFLFLLGLDALGDCAPDTGCRKGFLAMVLIPSVVIAAAAFWLTRMFLRARHIDDR